MAYQEYITRYINSKETGSPIYTSSLAEILANQNDMDIRKAEAAVSVVMKRLMDRNFISNLRCYQKGIYYKTAVTPFGEVQINKESLIYNKYLSNNRGYESGYMLLYKIGLTTQIPNERLIVTNHAKDCQRIDKALGVIIKPPKTTIDENNIKYFQILDVIDLLDKAPIDIENPYQIICNFIENNKLKYKTLLSLAYEYYSRSTIMKIARISTDGDED